MPSSTGRHRKRKPNTLIRVEPEVRALENGNTCVTYYLPTSNSYLTSYTLDYLVIDSYFCL